MGEQEQKQEATGTEQQQQQSQQPEQRKVELDEETYAALLDKIDELEGKVQQPKGRQAQHEDEDDDVDSLAREGRQSQGKQDEVNLDELSPSQLVKVIREQVSKEIAGPVLVAVNELKYSMEIDKLMRPVEAGGEGLSDLYDYKQEIMDLMIDNPKMTMKRAYTLAKAENPDKAKAKTKEATNGRDRDARLRHLPPHPKRTFGERPGQAESSTTEGEPKDLKGAAMKAFDEVFKGREV